MREIYFEIIKYGRVFIIGESLLIIGRNKHDAEKLEKFGNILDKNCKLIVSENYPAPVSIIFGKVHDAIIDKIKAFVKKDYADKVVFKF
jgi:hypothetical protein